ncbi:MAG TPA: TIGR04222 domain-containing membrane protein [Acidimicrobiia bacterium]|nr:TIGR04222 domain-containing membrane protein [Acidimicrobiia bacterium]
MGSVSVEAATLGLGAVLLATVIVTLAVRAFSVRNADTSTHDLALYQMAMLAGGAQRVCDTALSYLTWSGMIEVRESTDRLVRIVTAEKVSDIHPVEASILAALDATGVKPGAPLAAGRRSAHRHVGGLDGLTVTSSSLLVSGLVVTVGCAAVVLGAIAWMASSPAPSGFVPLIAVFAVVYAGWWVTSGRPRITAAGHEVLDRVRSRLDPDLQIAAIGVTSLPLERAMPVIAMYGRDALTGGLSGLRKVMTGNPAPSVLVARSSLSR